MATVNRIRALNRLPFDFEDGLKIGGVDVTNLKQFNTSAGAGLVGFTPVGGLSATNVQAAIAELDTEKARLDALAANNGTPGAGLVGYDGGTLKDIADNAKPLANYTALRNYSGTATQVRIAQIGLAGFFYRDDADTASADNGGTVILSSSGKRWKRLFDGAANVKWFGAVGDGMTNDRTAMVDAISYLNSVGGGRLYFPRGSYLVNSSFSVPNNIIFEGEGKRKSVIKRGFTGDLITSWGAYCGLVNIGIDGQQATFGAGRGVLMPSTTPNSFMLMSSIENFSQACLEFATDAGSTFRAISCDFYTSGALGVVGAVKVAGVDTQATSRHFVGCESGGCTLYDINGCSDMYVTGGYSNGLITTANTNKLLVTNMRIGAAAGTVILNGSSCRYTNSVFAVPVIFNATNSHFDCEVPDQNITDNGERNTILTRPVEFTTNWTCSGAAPSLGNATVKTLSSRSGQIVTVFYDITFGSTTTYGSGAWGFSLPRADYTFAPVQVSGGGFSQIGAGSAYQFQCRVTGGGGKVELFYVDAAGVLRNISSATRTWAAGDNIRFSVCYITQ